MEKKEDEINIASFERVGSLCFQSQDKFKQPLVDIDANFL